MKRCTKEPSAALSPQRKGKPHIVLVIARGEAVRNFLYSDALRVLSDNAKVTLLSLVDHGEVIKQVQPLVTGIVPLKEYQEHDVVTSFRHLVHTAHFRWIWSEAAKYYWGLHDSRSRTVTAKLRRSGLKMLARLLANRPTLEAMTKIDRFLTWTLRPTRDFEKLFRELQPNLVFNCSHIHGPQADLPLRVACHMGIPTAAFIFSWDNLTSRSRIFVPYDYYLVWNEHMKAQLLAQYRAIHTDKVFITGTPQFDFHFKPEFCLTREELCARVGLDPRRPFVLYTTGMDTDFPDEHRFIEAVICFLKEMDVSPRPQLVVRTYVKGTSPEVQALAHKNIPDVVFPPVLWDKQWIMPLHEDLCIYTSLLHHAALGINAASTVSLELMMLDKPVINIGMEPPGTSLPRWSRFSRHVEYEHYRPVVQSGGVMVARSFEDLRALMLRGLMEPHTGSAERHRLVKDMFGGTLDGNSGKRVADRLITLARTAGA